MPAKSINNKMPKNGEVRPLKRNIRYRITKIPSKNPRRELFRIKVKREKKSRNRSVSPGIKIEN
jgi:hypothetical protein